MDFVKSNLFCAEKKRTKPLFFQKLAQKLILTKKNLEIKNYEGKNRSLPVLKDHRKRLVCLRDENNRKRTFIFF